MRFSKNILRGFKMVRFTCFIAALDHPHHIHPHLLAPRFCYRRMSWFGSRLLNVRTGWVVYNIAYLKPVKACDLVRNPVDQTVSSKVEECWWKRWHGLTERHSPHPIVCAETPCQVPCWACPDIPSQAWISSFHSTRINSGTIAIRQELENAYHHGGKTGKHPNIGSHRFSPVTWNH